MNIYKNFCLYHPYKFSPFHESIWYIILSAVASFNQLLAEMDHEIKKMDIKNEGEGEVEVELVEIAKDEVELADFIDWLTLIYMFRSWIYRACWPGAKTMLFRFWYISNTSDFETKNVFLTKIWRKNNFY